MKTRKHQRSGAHVVFCCIVAVLAILASTFSIADPRVEIGVGQTRFHEREDGTWFQSVYGRANSLNSHSYMVGLSDLFPGETGKTYRFGWRAAYVDLGEFAGNNLATVHDDEAGKVDGSKCDPQSARGCLAWYKGAGKARGISLGATLERNIGPVVFSIEGGPFWFKSSYDVSVLHFQDCLFVPVGGIFEYRHATGQHLTWYAGARARYGWFYIDWRYYRDIYEQGRGPGGDVGLTGGKTVSATAGISVPF